MVPVQTGIGAAGLPGATVYGDTPADTPETVSFVLREQHQHQLESNVEEGIGHDLSVSQFAATYGQSHENIAALQAYLAGFGITTQVDADDVDVVASGTAGEFDSALSVRQHEYHVPGLGAVGGNAGIPAQNVHGTAQSPELPFPIAQYVLAIFGLTNYGPFSSQAVRFDPNALHVTAESGSDSLSASSCVALAGFPDACNTPANFAENYGLSPLYAHGAQGQGQTVAIVTLAAIDPGAPQYFWQNVLDLAPRSGTVTVENVDGGPGAPNADSVETDLDVEQAGAIAPAANVVVFQAPETDYGFVDAFFDAASQNIASTVSTSWLQSETDIRSLVASGSEPPAYEAAFDEAFLEMAAQGQSGFIGAGDWGAYTAHAPVDLGTTNLSVGEPADSPYVTVAGGTTLAWTADLIGPEGVSTVSVPEQRTWADDYLWQPFSVVDGVAEATIAEAYFDNAGGGGFSELEPEPAYQLRVPGTSSFSAVPYLTPTDYQPVGGLVEPFAWSFDPTPPIVTGSGVGRAVPDVSADADPATGYLAYSPAFEPADPPLEGEGGTSFVAAQLNASAAVIDSYLGRRVGFWNPAIYSFATSPNSPFTPLDVQGTDNDNLYYTGTPATLYNEGSGLGYPDLSKLAADFGSHR
ncbi:MAG: S53 family peptidase [Solirubrobacteraceae bacterium]